MKTCDDTLCRYHEDIQDCAVRGLQEMDSYYFQELDARVDELKAVTEAEALRVSAELDWEHWSAEHDSIQVYAVAALLVPDYGNGADYAESAKYADNVAYYAAGIKRAYQRKADVNVTANGNG